MKNFAAVLIVLAGLVIYLAGGFGVSAASAAAGEARDAFGFNSTNIAGFPHGNVILTGGGAYVPGTDFAHAGGHFRCSDSVLQGPLSTSIKDGTPCLAGQGIRWDTAGLLPSTTLKCTGAAAEPLKTATTSDTTVALAADFYRQGDGDNESFTANMAVSDHDLAPDIQGVQTVWIQGVGCGTGSANFNRTPWMKAPGARLPSPTSLIPIALGVLPMSSVRASGDSPRTAVPKASPSSASRERPYFRAVDQDANARAAT